MSDLPKETILNIKNTNLNHLLYFHTTAKAGSITQAAQILGLTQPTLSQQIMKLEATLGSGLFTRGKHQMNLTEDGTYLYQYTARIFDLTEEMLTKFNYHTYPSTQAMTRIGFGLSAPRSILTQLVSPLFQDSEFRVEIVEGELEHLVELMKKHELDFVLSAETTLLGEIDDVVEVQKIYEPKYHVAVAGDITDKPTQSLEQIISNKKYIKYPSHTQLQRNIDRFFLKNDLHPNVICECRDIETAVTFTMASNSFCIVPEIILNSDPNLVSACDLAAIEMPALVALYLTDFDNESVKKLVQQMSRLK